MKDVMDYAKFFLKSEDKNISNTFDGNMKLQKLLVLADMISIAKYGTPLFNEKILAFKNGFVVEPVRLRYKNDYEGFKKDSENFNPDFTEEEYKILNATSGIFEKLTAKELSEFSHLFKSWEKAYKNGFTGNFHDKDRSVVNLTDATDDIKKILETVNAWEHIQSVPHKTEIVNGSTFYFFDIVPDDEIMQKLEEFTENCEPDSYTVTRDGDELVIF